MQYQAATGSSTSAHWIGIPSSRLNWFIDGKEFFPCVCSQSHDDAYQVMSHKCQHDCALVLDFVNHERSEAIVLCPLCGWQQEASQ